MRNKKTNYFFTIMSSWRFEAAKGTANPSHQKLLQQSQYNRLDRKWMMWKHQMFFIENVLDFIVNNVMHCFSTVQLGRQIIKLIYFLTWKYSEHSVCIIIHFYEKSSSVWHYYCYYYCLHSAILHYSNTKHSWDGQNSLISPFYSSNAGKLSSHCPSRNPEKRT